MASKIDWQEAARSFSVDFDEFAKKHGWEALEPALKDLKEIQRLNKELYELDYKSKLSSKIVDELDSQAQQFRQLVADFVKRADKSEGRPEELRRLLNEVAVRKRDIRYFAALYLPYLRQEAKGEAIFKEQEEEIARRIHDVKSQEIVGDLINVFDEDLNRHRKKADYWLRLRLNWFKALIGLATVAAILFIVYFFIQDSFSAADILSIKLSLLPLVAIFLVGFAFANRNYRIEMHLYEIKVNKKISLKLLLGVMNSKVYDKASPDENAAMMKSACESIFNNGTVGHLRSQDHSESIVGQVMGVIRSK